MLHIQTKSFEQLTTTELYAILRLRNEVFVIEQNCVYRDIDGKDEKAFHVIGTKSDQVIAYTRIFRPGDYFAEAAIGRVVVKKGERHNRYGLDIMRASIEAIERLFEETVIHLSAQAYLKKFYSSLGFEQVGKGYLEDGIPHIGMVKKS